EGRDHRTACEREVDGCPVGDPEVRLLGSGRWCGYVDLRHYLVVSEAVLLDPTIHYADSGQELLHRHRARTAGTLDGQGGAESRECRRQVGCVDGVAQVASE